jgi:NTP pyrophosphatase (non-canonical NTP hydrolase)
MNVVAAYEIKKALNLLTHTCHERARCAGWWNDPHTGEDLIAKRNVGELLCLPERSSLEVELADALIRIFDLAGAYGLDLGGALVEKLEYNEKRADHKPENRRQEDGKRY